MRTPPRTTLLLVPFVAGALALAGCGASSGGAASSAGGTTSPTGSATPSGTATPSTPPSTMAPATLPRPTKTVVVVLENHGYDQVVGDSDAAWLNGLPAAVMTDWHGVAHPSQPNYVALFTGSTQGVQDDHCPVDLSGPSLGGQLLAAGHSFVGYSEGLPAAGSAACRAGRYARKHNPWADVRDVPSSANQPFSEFPSGHFDELPAVSFVVPDLCHDSHDCSTATADGWLRRNLGPYVSWARTHDSLLVVTYDEDDDHRANHIPTFFVGPMVQPGRYAERGDHYRMLRTLEAMYGLRPLGRAAGAAPVTSIWSGAAG